MKRIIGIVNRENMERKVKVSEEFIINSLGANKNNYDRKYVRVKRKACDGNCEYCEELLC